MESRTLGRTGLEASRLGYGGAPLGLAWYLSKDDPSDAATKRRYAEAVERAVGLGVTYFDTAPGYGDGRSEALLGELLGAHRDRVILATKGPWRGSADELERSLEASLRRLRTDRVDVLQFHGGWYTPEDADHILEGGLLDRMERLRDARMVRATGLTAEVPSGALERLVRTGRFDVLQVCYNVTSQLSCDHTRACRGIAAVAKARRMGLVAMRSPTSGFLQRLLALEFGAEVATPERVTRMALRYVLSTPEIDVALVGMRSPAEVEANAALASDLSDRYDLAALHDRYADRPEAAP
jgi:aryl-alcohol dehydrogenase-like predicted oxidoreductase